MLNIKLNSARGRIQAAVVEYFPVFGGRSAAIVTESKTRSDDMDFSLSDSE